ncbi:hypothetical protein [Nocardioides sp.]|uniref:hypothetical protein n=1 Tax=Nocardioides sp. TaxID=35761 RepID=UPI0037844000
MNVFVLCTGRCGSMTFVEASQHLTNYTAGHESRSARIGAARFDYPEQHVEVDNRLSWHLGGLGRAYRDRDVLYVHLRRDPEAVAQSFLKRWDSTFRPSIIRAFGHGIVQRVRDWPEERRIDVCRHYVDTVTVNIEEFLRDRPSMSVELETVAADFGRFLDRIGAEGDRAAALAEWGVRHNSSQ